MYLKASVRPNIDPWTSLPASIQASCGARTRQLLGAHWHEFNASQHGKRRKHEGEDAEGGRRRRTTTTTTCTTTTTNNKNTTTNNKSAKRKTDDNENKKRKVKVKY
jgi:hypothetical protein